MIKNFKKFQLLTESIASDLADKFDDDYIEEYYDKHHKSGLDEIISMSSHESIMNCFDEDEYKKDWVRDYISSYEFSEFDESDLKRYIKENLDNKKEKKILQIYNNNNYDEDDKDSERETEYGEYMVDELDKDELQEVIYDEDNCTEWIINSWYDGQDGIDIFDEFCGWMKKDGWYGYRKYGSFERIDSSELYKRVSNYIDDDKLQKEWDDGTDLDYKKDTVAEDIYNSPKLQRYLIKKDPDNVNELIDLWKENKFRGDDISTEYKFQKAYINKYLKDNIADEEDAKDEDYVSILKEDALLYLQDTFGLNDKIIIKYEPYMWKVRAKYKFNL